MFKPTFPQATTSSSFGFGASGTSTPFAQTSFGKVNPTPGFGSTAFGQASTPMFGGQNQTNTGLFSTPAPNQTTFGQTNTQQPFAFGASNTAANLFSQPQTSNNTSLFGGTSTTTFGQKPAFGTTFGSTTTPALFGNASTTQPAQPTQLFGSTTTNPTTGLFGASTSTFGTPAATQPTGTVIKFNPVTGTDTMVKNRITHPISTRHHCITFMKEYENKSLEELRYEDYLANRKGPQQGTSTGTNLFGGITSTVQPTGGLFGSTAPVSQGFGQSTSVFGSSTSAATNLFGQKPAFGQTASSSSPFSFSASPSTAATPFGSTAAKPFGAAAPTTGLFSTPATQSTSTFGQTNTFGFGATNSNTTTGLFNQNKSPASTFNLNPTSTTAFGQSAFGQTQQTNLFGAQKPATNVFGASTGFGQTATSQPTFSNFGQPQQQSSLFSNTTFNKPTSGFGLNQPQNTGMLSSFGTTPGSTNIFGSKTTTNLFNNPVPLTNPMSSFSNFLGSNTNRPPQFGELGQSGAQMQPTHTSASDLIATVQIYPEPAFLRNLAPADVTRSRSTNPQLIQNCVEELNFKVANSKPNYNLPVTTRRDPAWEQSVHNLFEGLDDVGYYDSYHSAPKRNPKRLFLSSKKTSTSSLAEKDKYFQKNNDVAQTNENVNNTSWLNRTSLHKVNENDDNENAHTNPNDNSLVDKTETVDISTSTSNSTSILIKSKSDDLLEKTGIICTRPDYYTIPSLEELAKLRTPDGKIIVNGFTIGRTSYGNVFFKDTFDVSNLNIDRDVHIRNKEIIIYTDDDNKPTLGNGLNRPAQITLDQCYPRDKLTRELVTDIKRLRDMKYDEILRIWCVKNDTRFVEYRPETGSWVFLVDHFTRYGIANDDEEEINIDRSLHEMKDEQIQKNENDILIDEEDDDDNVEMLIDMESDRVLSPPPLGIREMTEANNIKAMQMTFFSDDDAQSVTSSLASNNLLGVSNRIDWLQADLDYDTIDELVYFLKLQQERLKTPPPLESYSRAPAYLRKQDTIITRVNYLPPNHFETIYQEPVRFPSNWKRFDMFRKANIFRPKLNKRNIFFTVNPDRYLIRRTMPTNYGVYPISIILPHFANETKNPTLWGNFKQYLHAHLSIEHTFREFDQSPKRGIPYLKPKKGYFALHQHVNRLETQLDIPKVKFYVQHVFKLMQALWGYDAEIENEPHTSHLFNKVRRDNLAKWMKNYTEILLDKKKQKRDVTVYDYIVSHQLDKAVNLAKQQKNYNLSLMITQLGCSDRITKRLYLEQIECWKFDVYMNYINDDLLKIYALLANIPMLKKPDNTIVNVCHDLNWLEALAIHLHYLVPSEMTLIDCVNEYTKAFQTLYYAEPPSPIHTLDSEYQCQLNSSEPIYDIIYHLFCLYSNRSYSLNKLLNPITNTDDPLDYHLSWLVLQNLKAIGYSHIIEKSELKLNERFASQLEHMGMWHWAIFVLMHIECDEQRLTRVFELMCRNLSEYQTGDSHLEEEAFLVHFLKIPSEFIAAAKGYSAYVSFNFHLSLHEFAVAKESKSSRMLFWKYVLPFEIINKNNKYVKTMILYSYQLKFNDFYSPLIYFYIKRIDNVLNGLQSMDSSKRKKMIEYLTKKVDYKHQMKLLDFVRTLTQIETKSFAERAMFGEIIKSTVNYITIIYQLKHFDMDMLKNYAAILSKAPFPPDYMMSEAKHTLNIFLKGNIQKYLS